MRTSESEKNRNILGLFAKYIAMYGLSNDQLCETLQISKKTWGRRKKNIGSLSIEEFRRFVVRYNVPIAEVEKCL